MLLMMLQDCSWRSSDCSDPPSSYIRTNLDMHLCTSICMHECTDCLSACLPGCLSVCLCKCVYAYTLFQRSLVLSRRRSQEHSWLTTPASSRRVESFEVKHDLNFGGEVFGTCSSRLALASAYDTDGPICPKREVLPPRIVVVRQARQDDPVSLCIR